MSVVRIVGAGVTGLYLARELLRQGVPSVVIYEASGKVGGRWRTEGPIERGAWRLSLDSHPKALKLVREYSPVDPITYSFEGFVGRCAPVQQKLTESCPTGSGLSVRDWRTLTLSSEDKARRLDLRSGYHGQDLGACEIKEVYGTTALATHEDKSESGRFGTVRLGFEHVAQLLLRDVRAAGGRVHLGHRVTGADAHNRVRGVRRVGKNQHKLFTTPPADWLVWCVPPHQLPQTEEQLNANLDLVRAAVLSSPLVHIYAPLPVGATIPKFKFRTDLAVSQLIHHQPESGFWQPCYAAGEHARFWMRLYQADPKACQEELQKQCGAVLRRSPIPPEQVEHLLQSLATKLRVCYWEEAIHMWAPAWGSSSDSKSSFRFACRPNVARRPRVCVAGEAISTHQGWSEGGLQTADEVLRIINNNPTHQIPSQPTEDPHHVFFRGLYLSLKGWLERHPGGRLPLLNHLGEEIGNLWAGLHTSRRARQQLFKLLSSSTDPTPRSGR